MTRLIAAVFVCALPCILLSQDAAEMSTLVPSGDASPALNESATIWRVTSSSPSFSLSDGITQKVVSRTAGNSGSLIRLKTGDFSAPSTLTPPERSQYLAATRFVHPNDPRICSIAAKVSASKDPLGAARDFVHGYISAKELGMPLATDLQILSLRAGDCKEHTVLLVSVLRSAGIPSRAVAGVVFLPSFGGRRNVFGFHMWAEAYIGGKWLIADATFAGEGRPNRYIVLAGHSLKSVSPLDYIEAVSSIQNLTISRE